MHAEFIHLQLVLRDAAGFQIFVVNKHVTREVAPFAADGNGSVGDDGCLAPHVLVAHLKVDGCQALCGRVGGVRCSVCV